MQSSHFTRLEIEWKIVINEKLSLEYIITGQTTEAVTLIDSINSTFENNWKMATWIYDKLIWLQFSCYRSIRTNDKNVGRQFFGIELNRVGPHSSLALFLSVPMITTHATAARQKFGIVVHCIIHKWNDKLVCVFHLLSLSLSLSPFSSFQFISIYLRRLRNECHYVKSLSRECWKYFRCRVKNDVSHCIFNHVVAQCGDTIIYSFSFSTSQFYFHLILRCLASNVSDDNAWIFLHFL